MLYIVNAITLNYLQQSQLPAKSQKVKSCCLFWFKKLEKKAMDEGRKQGTTMTKRG